MGGECHNANEPKRTSPLEDVMPDNHIESVEFDRRRFHELSASAFFGVLAGSMSADAAQQEGAALQGTQDGRKPEDASNPFLYEPNICRGLNTCRGKGRGDGRGGLSACAGRSACATAPQHPCAGHNLCRGLGACDEGDPKEYEVGYPGENTCHAKGACGVPIPAKKAHVWQQARRRFEAIMADAGKKVGTAPQFDTLD
jgi:hypothetical protein